MSLFHGVFPALITPFSENGSINERTLRMTVDRCLKKGVDGFYVCGSTGEVFLLSADERKSALEIVVNEVKKRVPVICHIGCIATEHAAALGRHARAAGADAVSSLPPFYYAFTPRQIVQYYKDVAAASGLPMIIYNYPEGSKVRLGMSDFEKLFAMPEIAGVKHTSYDLYNMEQLKSLREDITVFNGHDEVFLAGFSMGADGAIGSTFNIIPEIYVGIKEHFLAGRAEEALALQKKATIIIATLLEVSLLPGLKYILSLMGIDAGVCRRPFLPLEAEAKKKLEKLYTEYIA